MNERKQITSELIELYCLGVLGPEESQDISQQAEKDPVLKAEIERYQNALVFETDFSFSPVSRLKAGTMALLENLRREESGELSDLPMINKYSDHHAWLKIVKPLLPSAIEGMFVKELRSTDGIEQAVIWTLVDYPDEVHEDVNESFIILEGRCVCFIEDEIVELGPGGFIEIPLYKHHDVKVLEPVLAVVQRVKVA